MRDSIESESRGTWAYYRLVPEAIERLRDVFAVWRGTVTTHARGSLRLRPQRRPQPDGSRARRSSARTGASTSARPGALPASEINPAVVEAMAELGVDLSEEFPKPLTDEVVQAADVVITMGCGDACPIYPGKRYEDWALDDPAGQDLETVRRIRDEIDARVQALVAELARLSRRPRSRARSSPKRRHVRARLRRLRRDHGRREDTASSVTSASRSRFGLVIMAMIYASVTSRARTSTLPSRFAFALTRHFPWRAPSATGPPRSPARSRRGAPPRVARQHRPRRRDAPVAARRRSRSSGSSC